MADSTVVILGTTIGAIMTALVEVLLGVANFRKTQAETRRLAAAEHPDEVAPATSPRDSEAKLFTMLTTQLETSYKRCDQIQADLDACRQRIVNRRARGV